MKGKVVHKRYYIRPDGLRKQQVADIYIESVPHLSFAKKCRKPIRLIALILAIAYFLMGVAVNSWNVAHGNGVETKTYIKLIAAAAIIFTIGCLIAFAISLFIKHATQKDICERCAEELEMHSDYLRYYYRINNSGSKRHILTANYDALKAEYNPMLRRLVLRGALQVMTLEGAIVGSEKKSTESVSSFVIYDYFEPSLHLALKHEGVLMFDESTREWDKN